MESRMRLYEAKTKQRYRVPKLIQIGDSVGLVIGKNLLESIGWKKGDFIAVEYFDKQDELRVRNISASERSDE